MQTRRGMVGVLCSAAADCCGGEGEERQSGGCGFWDGWAVQHVFGGGGGGKEVGSVEFIGVFGVNGFHSILNTDFSIPSKF